jgi:hypothetical protein
MIRPARPIQPEEMEPCGGGALPRPDGAKPRPHTTNLVFHSLLNYVCSNELVFNR